MREYEWAIQRALVDGLTGLYNHSHFLEEVQRELGRAQRYQRPLALILVDIDNFHHYNERNGYLAGDKVLVAVGALLRSLLRDADLLARYGGEEFAALLPETGPEGARTVAERILVGVQAYPIPNREKQPGGALTVSVGVVGVTPSMQRASDLMGAAQAAVATAKKQGGNRIVVAGE